jgi:uncharacterized membrane protein YraQ (UPF0718 family)
MLLFQSIRYDHPQWTTATMAVARDRVVQALLLGLLSLFLLDRAQFLPSLEFTLVALWQMLPFFLVALGLAGWTRAAGADAVIARLFAGHPLKSIFLAAAFGAVSPFCSCGVIPVIAALLVARVPLAPVMAFWIASPIMDPEMFVLTAAGISFEFAIAKTIAALSMGLFAGLVTMGLSYSGLFEHPMKSGSADGCGNNSCAGERNPAIVWAFWKETARRELFNREFISTGLFLGKWLTIAFFLESLMLAYLPAETVASVVGSDDWYVIPLAALVGVPAYLNGYAAIPLVSGLIDLGMSPGAALAFVTAGAVSSFPAAMAVIALVRLPVFTVYLSLGLIGSIATGVIYQVLVAHPPI